MSKPRVDFKRIAIFNATAIIKAQTGDGESSTETNAIRQWALAAQQQGMDAAYIRAYDLSPERIPIIVDTIKATGVSVIVPHIYAEKGIVADAYHLRSTDLFSPRTHQTKIIGRSCHTLEEVLAAETCGLDYVFFSPIFQTPTHPEAKGVGLEVLSEVCRATILPVFALGGINRDNAELCIAAGAHGIAAISMFLPSGD